MSTLQQIRFLLGAALLASCSATAPVAQHADDVYFMPSTAPVAVKKQAPKPTEAEASAPASDDYYDEGVSRDLGVSRGYYDMAYNDPQYYNYGRFGFGGPMGWESGWNGPGWGMGFGSGLAWQNGRFGPGWGSGLGMSYGWGYGTGAYSGWFRPTFGFGYNYGWGNPWNGGWNQFGMYNDPYYFGGGGYGWGNYWGPMGPCPWYSPIVIGGSSVVGHRPSMSTGGGQNGTVRQPRMALRDPVGLRPSVVEHRSAPATTRDPVFRDAGRGSPIGVSPRPFPGTRDTGVRSAPGRTIERPSTPRGGTIESRPSLNRGGGESAPSRSGGGGSAPARRGR